jgi:hypothetical protein
MKKAYDMATRMCTWEPTHSKDSCQGRTLTTKLSPTRAVITFALLLVGIIQFLTNLESAPTRRVELLRHFQVEMRTHVQIPHLYKFPPTCFLSLYLYHHCNTHTHTHTDRQQQNPAHLSRHHRRWRSLLLLWALFIVRFPPQL